MIKWKLDNEVSAEVLGWQMDILTYINALKEGNESGEIVIMVGNIIEGELIRREFNR